MNFGERLVDALDAYIESKISEKLYARESGEQGVTYALDVANARLELSNALSVFLTRESMNKFRDPDET